MEKLQAELSGFNLYHATELTDDVDLGYKGEFFSADESKIHAVENKIAVGCLFMFNGKITSRILNILYADEKMIFFKTKNCIYRVKGVN